MLMQSILSASQSMTKMQTMQSARDRMQGTANVLNMESKQDGGNKIKDAKAEALEKKSVSLMVDLINQATDVNESLKTDEETKVEKDPVTEKTAAGKQVSEKRAAEKQEITGSEKNQKQDSVTLSDIAAGYRGSAAVHPVLGEAAIYTPSGISPNLSGEPAKTIQVTA